MDKKLSILLVFATFILVITFNYFTSEVSRQETKDRPYGVEVIPKIKKKVIKKDSASGIHPLIISAKSIKPKAEKLPPRREAIIKEDHKQIINIASNINPEIDESSKYYVSPEIDSKLQYYLQNLSREEKEQLINKRRKLIDVGIDRKSIDEILMHFLDYEKISANDGNLEELIEHIKPEEFHEKGLKNLLISFIQLVKKSKSH